MERVLVQRTLIIACGALAREITAIIKADGLSHLALRCLPATLHNRPELIAEAVRRAIEDSRGIYHEIYVAYADCGTGGALDRVLTEQRVERLHGPHCYASFAGQKPFEALAEAEPGSFYLTDFLVRQFETLIIRGLGIDRHPELRDLYFANYRRLVYLAQTDDAALTARAEAAAARLGLAFERVPTGMGELGSFVRAAAKGALDGRADDSLLARHPRASDRQGRPQNCQAPVARALRAGHRSRGHAGKAHRDRRISRPVAEV
jgi:hypothetical protein